MFPAESGISGRAGRTGSGEKESQRKPLPERKCPEKGLVISENEQKSVP
jgi:hypothetical protein